MNINRNNYEEFFLLYVDNELSVDQKKQVDLFIQQHPDLEEELVALQQSILIPEQIEFDNKELLMRDGNSFININNYEECFTLYVDDELSLSERKAVEGFAAADPVAKKEFDLFRSTKLEAEEIIFPGKNSLYRREEKVRVIRMQWWKVAVAAVLIIAAGITTYTLLNNKPGDVAPIVKINEKTTPVVKPVDIVLPKVEEEEPQQLAVATANKQSNQSQKEIKKNNELPEEKITNNLPQPQQPVIAATDPADVKQSIDGSTANTSSPTNTAGTSAFIDSKSEGQSLVNNSGVTNNNSQSSGNVETPGKLTNPVVQYEYASNTESSENKKLRGFFRKATRFIERTTNVNPANDDNRVLIGGMAVSLK
jgi:hypothetical protein